MAVLSERKRNKLNHSDFAIPEKAPGSGSYPIPDEVHARAALSMVAKFGTPAERKRVRQAVCHRFRIGCDRVVGSSPAAHASPHGHESGR